MNNFQCVFIFLLNLSKNPPTNVIALAANKSEPLKCHSAIDLHEVMNYAKDNKLIFMETSAKTAMNVQELFVTVGMCTALCLSLLEFDYILC